MEKSRSVSNEYGLALKKLGDII
ncbi:hypothetical protein CCACVL1_01134 [Corchorus capsularis]|uniref:Uncharacterized protein n=1 Tax=Corchorus capsularis TaxID=210143 RepID=A0A1R3KMG5_COCAP|nr:hypothetical protein CCACVL1_01134 [Corchorus capsularis]